jgi:putative transposase
VLDALQQRWPWLKHLFGDAAHARKTLMDKAGFMDFTVEVVRELEGQQDLPSSPPLGD